MTRNDEPFITRVSVALNTLPPTERRLAEFILSFPGEVLSYTASELAAAARVSKPVISRFVRKLGYENYAEARRQIRIEQKRGSPLFLLEQQKSAGSLQMHFELAVTALSETYSALDEESLERILSCILESRHVWLAGFRSNYSFASYFKWQMLRVVDNITVIPGAGETLGEYCASFCPDDIMVIFAMRRTSSCSAELIAQAIRMKMKVLCITDEMTENPGPASWVIQCKTRAGGALDNHVAVMALIHFFVTRLIELSGSAGRKRMARIEAAHAAFNEL